MNDRAWVLLGSGNRIDLIDPQPNSWTDRDLAVGLSRTYRWGGHSRWELPLSVAQHSLLVLALREASRPYETLSRTEALRELLHDAEEGLLGFDPISPLKPHLGGAFGGVVFRLRAAINARYELPDWSEDDYRAHKAADHLAAASEAIHVVGWTREDLRDSLHIDLTPVDIDPLPTLPGLRQWAPWPPTLAAALFLAKLEELAGPAPTHAHRGQPADLCAVFEREQTIRALKASFGALSPETRGRCRHQPRGSSLTDTLVIAEPEGFDAPVFEGLIVDGERDPDGTWDFDCRLKIFTIDHEFVGLEGCNTDIQVL